MPNHPLPTNPPLCCEQYCARECQKADWASHKRVCSSSAESNSDAPSRTSSSGKTKEQLTSQWMHANMQKLFCLADLRDIDSDKIVVWLDFTRAGADGAVPLFELFDEDNGAMAELKRRGAEWWSPGQEANIRQFLEKRRTALAAGIQSTQIVHVCRFETSVFAGRFMLADA